MVQRIVHGNLVKKKKLSHSILTTSVKISQHFSFSFYVYVSDFVNDRPRTVKRLIVPPREVGTPPLTTPNPVLCGVRRPRVRGCRERDPDPRPAPCVTVRRVSGRGRTQGFTVCSQEAPRVGSSSTFYTVDIHPVISNYPRLRINYPELFRRNFCRVCRGAPPPYDGAFDGTGDVGHEGVDRPPQGSF